MTHQQQVKQLLYDLKEIKIPVTKIEQDLNISPGLLWKVKSGFQGKRVPEKKMEELIKYHKKNMDKIAIKNSTVSLKQKSVPKKSPEKEEKKMSMASYLGIGAPVKKQPYKRGK